MDILTLSMDKELKMRWADALDSGEYQQGYGHLFKDNKYCCLGVLAQLEDPLWVSTYWERSPGLGMQSGLSYENVCELARRNDGMDGYHKHTFPEIAKLLRERDDI